jgi:hypothetical protein
VWQVKYSQQPHVNKVSLSHNKNLNNEYIKIF